MGFPGVPDHVSLWGLLIPIRRGFKQYVNLRPIRLLAGVDCPLRDRKPGEIDFYVVRENNEGDETVVVAHVVEAALQLVSHALGVRRRDVLHVQRHQRADHD